ncbi:MAG: hypothetical protein M3159_06820 [Actinomycetota bacterium]|nr:hypothetical protein [Actinomycetota bacterium]
MSLAGYATGPGADEQHGLGDAPELHTGADHERGPSLAGEVHSLPRLGVHKSALCAENRPIHTGFLHSQIGPGPLHGAPVRDSPLGVVVLSILEGGEHS